MDVIPNEETSLKSPQRTNGIEKNLYLRFKESKPGPPRGVAIPPCPGQLITPHGRYPPLISSFCRITMPRNGPTSHTVCAFPQSVKQRADGSFANPPGGVPPKIAAPGDCNVCLVYPDFQFIEGVSSMETSIVISETPNRIA